MKPYSSKHKTANHIINLPKTAKRNATRRQFKRYFKKALRQIFKKELQQEYIEQENYKSK